MPPAIHSKMSVSAVGLGWVICEAADPSLSPAQTFGAPAASAESVAAEAVFRKSRRVGMGVDLESLHQLKLRQHENAPHEIGSAGGGRRVADDLPAGFQFGFRRVAAERGVIQCFDHIVLCLIGMFLPPI